MPSDQVKVEAFTWAYWLTRNVDLLPGTRVLGSHLGLQLEPNGTLRLLDASAYARRLGMTPAEVSEAITELIRVKLLALAPDDGPDPGRGKTTGLHRARLLMQGGHQYEQPVAVQDGSVPDGD